MRSVVFAIYMNLPPLLWPWGRREPPTAVSTRDIPREKGSLPVSKCDNLTARRLWEHRRLSVLWAPAAGSGMYPGDLCTSQTSSAYLALWCLLSGVRRDGSVGTAVVCALTDSLCRGEECVDVCSDSPIRLDGIVPFTSHVFPKFSSCVHDHGSTSRTCHACRKELTNVYPRSD
jgi:hypothetical protein